MNKVSALLCFVIFIQVTSCNYFEVKNSSATDRFMPGEYFSMVADSLNAQKKAIEKTVLKDGVSETVIIDSVDWYAELKPFININISKPAQSNSYIIDSIQEAEVLKLNYVARDSSVSIKQINIVFINEQLSRFRAIQSSSNMYYRSIDTIEYFNGGKYRISAMSKPRLGKEVNFLLSARVIE